MLACSAVRPPSPSARTSDRAASHVFWGEMQLLKRMWIPGLMILVALLLIWWFPSHQLIVPVAQAILGAAVVGGFVEAYARASFTERLVRDTAHILIGFEMPPLLQDKIRQIIKETVVRTDWELRYSVEPEGPGVRVHVESKYLVRSYAGAPAPYTMQLDFEPIEDARVLEMRCDHHDRSSQFCLNPEVDRSAGVHTYRGREISLKPGQTYPMMAKYSTRGTREGSDVFVFGGHAAVVTVIVENTDRYTFDLSVGEHEVDVIQTPGRWRFERGFIKGQHLRIRWQPRPDPQESPVLPGSPASAPD